MSDLARNRRTLIALCLAVLAVAAAPAARASEWCLDKPHSSIAFSIRHLVSMVPGSFRDLDGTVQFDPADPGKAAVDIAVQATSIDTGNSKRDGHLRSADFFEVEKFPTLTFKSEKVSARSKDEYDLTGALTIHGVTRTVTVPVKLLGMMDAPKFGKKAGFQGTFTISRKDYGITYNDPSGLMLGDDVIVTLNFELNDIAACKPKGEAPKPAAAPAAPAAK